MNDLNWYVLEVFHETHSEKTVLALYHYEFRNVPQNDVNAILNIRKLTECYLDHIACPIKVMVICLVMLPLAITCSIF